MLKWILITVLALLVLAFYFYTDQTKEIINAALALLK